MIVPAARRGERYRLTTAVAAILSTFETGVISVFFITTDVFPPMAESPEPAQTDQLYALANSGNYDDLIEYIRHHEDEAVRYGAAGIVAESSEEVAAQATPQQRRQLIDTVLDDPSDAVRAQVVSILLAIDESTIETIVTELELAPESTPTDTPYPLVLTKWHASPRAPLRFLAVVGFGRIGSQSAIAKLRTTLTQETDLRVLRRAIEEAGSVGDETVVEPIQEHLRADETAFQQSNPERIERVKVAAVDALIELGTDAAYEALVAAARSTDERLKEHVIGEIGRFGAQETVDLVVDELDTRADEAVRAEAAEGVMTTFQAAEFDEGDAVRQRAIEQIADEVSVDVSREFASIVEASPADAERRNAAWLLGQLESNSKTAASALAEAIQADDGALRQIAAASLTQLETPEVDTAIESVLETADEDSEAYALASFVQSARESTAEEAKKELVEYTHVVEPSDYGTTSE